jgi:hypothetical protein
MITGSAASAIATITGWAAFGIAMRNGSAQTAAMMTA